MNRKRSFFSRLERFYKDQRLGGILITVTEAMRTDWTIVFPKWVRARWVDHQNIQFQLDDKDPEGSARTYAYLVTLRSKAYLLFKHLDEIVTDIERQTTKFEKCESPAPSPTQH